MKVNCDICTAEDVVLPKNPKGKLLYCTCPFCNSKVGAEINDGYITCPACKKKATWRRNVIS